MARRKETIIQRDMRLMEIREDFLERDDSDVRSASLKTARNMRSLATGATEARPGLMFRRMTALSANHLVEFRPADNVKFGVYVTDDALVVFDADGSIVHDEETVPWTSAEGLYTVPLRTEILIGGSFGIYLLQFRDSVWTFGEFAFAAATGGELAQPYWTFNPGTQIRSTARTGAVVITSSDPVFKAGHVGLRIRYLNREILITGFTSTTTLSGTVVSELPPSFRLTVESTSGFQVGDAIVGNDSNYQGRITAIDSATQMRVVTLFGFDGPFSDTSINENISGPNTTTKIIVGGKVEIDPEPTEIWDEPMMSDVRGWPRSASTARERLFFVNFPLIPSAVAVSSARGITDFSVGSADDDGIVREIGDGQPRLLHAINAGDLLIFSDKGCYLIFLRDQGILSPSTFNTILYDDRGASTIPPVRVNDGVVFVESNNQNVSVALLDGRVQLRWRVSSLTTAHSHLIRAPVGLCGPAIESEFPEKYLFVINSDGTLAALSYSETLDDQVIGVAPWDTDGTIVDMAPIFGKYWALIDRQTTAGTARYLENFEEGMLVDSAVEVETQGNSFEPLMANGETFTVNSESLIVSVPHVGHLASKEVYVIEGTNVMGPYEVGPDGVIADLPDVSGIRQIGLNFTSEAAPWPVEILNSTRAGTFDVRCIRFLVAVQNTGEFSIRANNDTRIVGGYDFGDVLGNPPLLQNRIYRVPVFGRRTYADLAAIKHKPSQFRILYLGQEVQG